MEVAETPNMVKPEIRACLNDYREASRQNRPRMAARSILVLMLLTSDLQDRVFQAAWKSIRDGRLRDQLYDVYLYELTWRELDNAFEALVQLLDRSGLGLREEVQDEADIQIDDALHRLDLLADTTAQGPIVEVPLD